MTNSDDIYIRRNITRRWKKSVCEAEGIFAVFSPYITSKTADRILLVGPQQRNCYVYTLFDVEVFVNGSSSLSTLRKIVTKGVKLFALSKLHAKIVIVPDTFATIGSQNLTKGGTRRLESSVVVTNPKTVNHIWKQTASWRKNAKEITLGMITEMEKQVGPLRKKFRRLQSEMCEADRAVEKTRITEQQKNDNRRRTKKRLNELRRRTTRQWSLVPKSRSSIPCKVTINKSLNGGRTFSLRPTTVEASLISWQADIGSKISLTPFRFYPCMIEDSWRFGFVRLAKTRITFVGDSVKFTKRKEVGGKKFILTLESSWDDDSNGANLIGEFNFSTWGGYTTITIPLWFDLDGLTLQEPTIDNLTLDKYKDREADIRKWFKQNRNEIKNLLLTQITDSFRYHSPLSNSQAHIFFGNPGTRYNLKIGKVHGNHIIVAKKL